MEDMAVTCTFLDQCFAVAHERILHYARGEELAADIDLYLLAGRGWDAREADRALQRGRERAAGHLTFADAGHDDFLMAAQHAAIFEHESDQLARHAAAPLRFERRAADEIAICRVERNRPRNARFQRREVLVHVVAVEIHAGFEPQRIARAQS